MRFDDDELRRLYVDKDLSARAVASQLGASLGPVYRRLREPGIVRSNADAHKRQRPGNYRGWYRDSAGYIMIHLPNDHPFVAMGICAAHESVYIREHRLVMAKSLGRCLLPYEVVHHKNGNREDNKLENLEMLSGQSEHHAITLAHQHIKKLEAENGLLKKELEGCLAAMQVVAVDGELPQQGEAK